MITIMAKVRQIIQVGQNRVGTALYVAVPGTTMPGIAVSRFGATAIPTTGIAATVSASFSSRSLVES